MTRYVLNRLALMVPTLFGVALITFFIMRIVPGDIVELRYFSEGGGISEEQLQAERARLGLHKPIWVQFVDWMSGLVKLDFGRSMWTDQPVAQEIAIRLELTLELAILATLISVALALPLGVLAAVKQDTWVDHAIRIFSVGGISIPSFWLGLVIILGLLILFHWSPPVSFASLFDDPLHNLSQLFWPAISVGYRYSAVATRMTRSAVLEVLREDYIRTARAKGLAEKLLLARHALRNALLPVVTVIGLEFAFLIGGLVVTEQVFNLNGVARLLVEAVIRRDYTMVQALIMLIATTFVVVNFLVDLLYVWLDPRISYR